MTTLKAFLSFLFACSVYLSSAQSNAGSIRGLLKDSSGKQVLSLATVTVFTAKDTAIVTYRLSDNAGNFKIPGIPLNIPCRVLASFSGYKTFRKDFQLTKGDPQLDLGTVLMQSDSKDLEEVVVYAERPPVLVRKDTIEFNASAFKTLPSALLEDLLKKLPGLDIDADGNIMVKGKRVNKLLVDGKEFFGGDPQIATRNLPANIVDKVQVMNDKEEMRRNPNMRESEIGQIVNIKLKKSIKQGWFGKAYAGGGTDGRHEAGAILNAFRDTVQISVLGYTNNINKPGFGINDIQRIGGFERSGYNSMMVMSDGGFAINDISFGGTGQGLQRSTGGGLNFNDQLSKKVTLNLQYFYGQINSDMDNINRQQRFFKDTILSSSGTSNYSTTSANHRIGGTIKWQIDSLTTLTIRPGVTLSASSNFSKGSSLTDENYRGKINRSNSISKGSGNSNNYAYNMFLDRNFKKSGRYLSVNADFSNVHDDNDQYTDGLFSTYNAGLPDDSLVNQLRKTGGSNTNSTTSVSFSEPLAKKISLRVSHTLQYTKQNNDISFFSRDTFSGKYDLYNRDFSNGIKRDTWKNTSGASLSLQLKKISVNPGINFLTASFRNRYTKNPMVSQHYQYVYPSLSVYGNHWNISYGASIQEPQASDLQQVVDISNRFYQRFGNPDLKPAFRQTVNMYTGNFNAASGNSYSAYLNGSISKNAVIRVTTIDHDGLQTTRPVNVNGTYDGYGGFNYNYQYKLSMDYKITVRPGLYGFYSKTFVSVNGSGSGQNNLDINPSLSLNLNIKDKLELNQRYTKSFKKTTYDDRTAFKNIDVNTHSIESEVVIRMPRHMVWENQINYTYNPQVAQGIRRSSVRWNAGVNYLFLKDDKAQIKLSVYDLLKQNISVYRYTGENYVSDVQNTTLTRYFMLTFTYNLRNFTGGKVGGKDRSFFLF